MYGERKLIECDSKGNQRVADYRPRTPACRSLAILRSAQFIHSSAELQTATIKITGQAALRMAFDPQPSPANPSAIERVYLRLATAETGRSTRRPLASMLCRRIATRSAPDK